MFQTDTASQRRSAVARTALATNKRRQYCERWCIELLLTIPFSIKLISIKAERRAKTVTRPFAHASPAQRTIDTENALQLDPAIENGLKPLTPHIAATPRFASGKHRRFRSQNPNHGDGSDRPGSS